MEFLAERYSREDGLYGWVHRFAIGNEVDISTSWNAVANYDKYPFLNLANYVEEYLRTLRLAEQATKKYYGDSMVLVSTAHYWTGGHPDKRTDGRYPPKYLYDSINERATYEGNFNWGMATHSYAVSLGDNNFLYNDPRTNISGNPLNVSGDYNACVFITWTNFEITEEYLKQPHMLYKGQMRRIYSTEAGVSSGTSINATEKALNERLQAAGVAYAYYKSVSMDCLDAFIYYRTYDAEGDGSGLNFGVLYGTGERKLSYEVFKYMDTNRSFEIADQYLTDLRAYRDGVTYGSAARPIPSYRWIMDMIPSPFDWDAHWDLSKIMVRTAD